jgi:hypothetical protein
VRRRNSVARQRHLTRKSNTRKEDNMGKVVVSEFVSLDGVMEDPGGAARQVAPG